MSRHVVFGTVRSLDKAGKLQSMAADAGVEINLVELDVAADESVRSGKIQSGDTVALYLGQVKISDLTVQ